MARLLINKQEMVLLKNSESAKDTGMYGNLLEVLEPYDVLSEDDFKNNQIINDTARAVILNNKRILFDAIKEEWVGIGCHNEDDREIRCQLCNTRNKLIFYIHNKNNGKELNVGSECIKKFPNIENVNIIKSSYNQQKKLNMENKRKIQFDEIDLDNIEYIKNTEKWFKEFKVILPYELFENIRVLLFDLNTLKTNYVKTGGDFDNVKKEYFYLKNNLEDSKSKAEQFYESIKLNPLVCKRDLYIWLGENYGEVLEKIKKNGGLLAEDTLKFCYYKNFVESKLRQFNSKIMDKDIAIVGMNGDSIRFKIENSNFHIPVIFLVKNNYFMKNIGCYCLTNKEYRFAKQDITVFELEVNNSNFDALCNRIRTPLGKIGLGIERDDITGDVYYVRLPRMVNTGKSMKKMQQINIGYLNVSEKFIFDNIGKHIFDSDDVLLDFFKRLYDNLSRREWMSAEKKKEKDDLSRSLAIQQQKEFVPYV